MTFYICEKIVTCDESKNCGGALPHQKGTECGNCPRDKEAKCMPLDRLDNQMKCLIQWIWFYRNPGEGKFEYTRWCTESGFADDLDEGHYGCWACVQAEISAINIDILHCCRCCPITWPTENGCGSYSPYFDWVYNGGLKRSSENMIRLIKYGWKNYV